VDAEAHDIHGKLRPPSDFVVAEVAARQWGVASLKQLLGLGLTRGAIEHRSRMGRLHRVHRGVYAVGHTRLGSQGRALAAVLACGERAVLSHRSAGAWCDLLAHEGARVEVTVPHGRHALPGVLVHQSRSLAPRDTIIHDGMPITSLARTLLDLAATVKRGQLERALAQAERLQLYDHAAITDVLARANGHRGQRRLGEATAREPKWTRNEFEVRLLKIIRGAGLPEPDTNPAFVALDHTDAASRTSTGRHTTSSSRPTAGRATAREPPSRVTAPRMPPSPPRATASCASRGAHRTRPSSGASAPYCNPRVDAVLHDMHGKLRPPPLLVSGQARSSPAERAHSTVRRIVSAAGV
jgi:Transcriptional regulator, AbiEi antitoxin